MNHWLFAQGDLAASLEAQAAKMRDVVEREPEESLKQADLSEWARALAHHFAVTCPTLKPGEVWREPPQDITMDVSRDPMRYFSPGSDLAYNFPAYRVVVHVPFDGDSTVFKLKTSTFGTNWPRGQVNAHDVALTIDYPRSETPDIDARAREFIEQVERYLGWAREQIDNFNGRLEQRSRETIEARRRRLEERDAHLATSTIPVRRPGASDKTYIADSLVRRPAPLLPQNRADDQPPMLEPVLDERVFEHILDVIRRQSLSMEQNPGTFADMGEEQLRNVIVGALATHYDGFTAETDNRGGHTDILARHEARNVFIAECKIWNGEKSLSNAVDQLFGYAGWRDTKLALIIFVRERDLTAIIRKGADALTSHAQFVESSVAANETELRAAMRWPGDDERLADINVFFVPIWRHLEKAK